MFSPQLWEIIENWKRLWRRTQIYFQGSTGCYLKINWSTTLRKQLEPVKSPKSCSNRWVMGNCSSFTRALYTKSSSGGRRISFSGRTGPNSRVAPTSFPRQGSSGKSLSEKLIVFQHASRIGPTREDTFCSRRFIFSRDTTKSEVGRQIKTFLKNWKKLTGEKKIWKLCKVTKCHITWIHS